MMQEIERIERRIVKIRKREKGKEKEEIEIMKVMEKEMEMIKKGKKVRMMMKDI